MHELSIALNIIDFVRRETVRRGLHDLDAVGVRIGALSAIDPEALEFGFTAACRGTDLDNIRLEIEWIQAHIKCQTCGHEHSTDHPEFMCAKCNSSDVSIMRGYELEVAYFEAADE